jgi:uncharacterized protein (DUF58 family)
MTRLRQAMMALWMRWIVRRHGRDVLPITINRRRIYIVPTRFGMTLGLLLVAMLLAGLNYNSNLGLAFGFLMTSLVLVAMHHCHRNLQGLALDVRADADAFAGGVAHFDFVLRNDAGVERCDIEIRCAGAASMHRVAPRSHAHAGLDVPTPRRGVVSHPRFELRTRHPFGWFRAWTYVQTPLTAFVAPAPGGGRSLPPAAASAGMAGQSELRGDDEFAGLRSYEAGVPLKHMAWKVLARGGEAAVRSYTAPAAQPEWLDWSALPGLDTEARLAQLCRWILDSDRARHGYGVRLPGADIAPGTGAAHRMLCLRALARYGTATPP